MLRIGLFLLTNLTILVVLSVTMSLLGFEPYMRVQGVQMDLQALLIFAAVFGMGGALISLAISKMIAALERLKRTADAPELPDQLRAFGIAGGLRGGLSRLFMSHPPLDERIAALESSLRARP